MNMKKKLCAALSALCIAEAAFAAQTLRVVSREEDKTGVWADAYTSIADAIAAANTGTEASHDTILVASGTYNIDDTIIVPVDTRVWLAIRSANLETGEEDRDGTILDGGGSASIMKVQSAAVRVSGFTFQNGSKASETYASSAGAAAIQITRHKVVVNNCVFRGNRSVNVAGTCVNCTLGTGNLTVSGCIFTNNTQEISVSGENYAAKGVAIYSTVNTVTVKDCLFDGNSATAESANGLLMSGGSTGWAFDNCTFLTNTFTRSGTSSARTSVGGSVYINGSTMRNCRFSCNAYKATGSDFIYGSVLSIVGSCTLSNCTFTSIVDSNNSESMFGTIYVNGDDVSFLDCAFTDNTVGKYFIHVQAKTNTLFRNCLFADNVRGTTGHRLIRQYNCPAGTGLLLENCTFANNTDTIGDTKVHLIGSGGTSSCTNIYVNTVFTGYLHPHPTSTSTIARNCCFGSLFDNTFLEKTDCFMVSDVPGGDLKFIGAAEGNYQLQQKSPLREKGIVLPWMSVTATDLAGNLRVVSTEGEPLAVDPSALPDIGCYECVLKPGGLIIVFR